LQLNPDVLNKVRFIYTGSIGLNHTVAAIDSTAFINDLNTLEIEPLTAIEAGELLDSLLAVRGVVMRPSARNYLLDKLEWLIPFHIQLLVQELKYALEMLRLVAKDGVISRAQLLDQAYVFDVVDQYKKIIEILVYDGYINNVGQRDICRFNSPVVRLWWNKYAY